MAADGTAGWQADCWIVGWLLDVHIPWTPHWTPIFIVMGFTSPFRGDGSCAGPTVVVDM